MVLGEEIVFGEKKAFLNLEISCSEGEEEIWNIETEIEEDKEKEIVRNEEEKIAEKWVEKRQFRKRRPEQKRPYTYDFLRHNEEFRRIGINPVENESMKYLELDDEDTQYESQDSKESQTTLAHIISENEEFEEFKRNKPSATFINPNRHNWRLKRVKKALQKQAISSLERSKKAENFLHYNSDTEITIFKSAENLKRVSEIENEECGSENDVSNVSEVSFSSHHSPSMVPIKQDSRIKYTLQDSSESDTKKEDYSYEEQIFMNDISRYKRKLKGILPPSYLTLENKFIISNSHSKMNPCVKKTYIQEENRKGLVKKKMAKFPSTLKPFSINIDTNNLSHQPKKIKYSDFKENKNNNYYSSNESSDANDVSERKLINRMYSGIRGSNNYTYFQKRHRKDNTYENSLKKISRYLLPEKTKRLNKSSFKFIKKKKRVTRIGILDLFKQHKDRNQQAPPRFINLVCRIMKSRKDLGRTYPYRKVFFFDNFDDRQEINEIFEKWRQGTLTPVYSKNDIFSCYTKPKSLMNSISFTENIPCLSSETHETKQNVEVKDVNFKKIIGKMLFQGRLEKNISENFMKRSNKSYYERIIPKSCITDKYKSIYDWLDKLPLSKPDIIDKIDNNMENKMNDLKTRHYNRKSIAKRIDSNHFDDTIIHRHITNKVNVQRENTNNYFQQSLEQFWLQKSTFSMTFNVNPIKQDIFFDSETFIGSGLLQKLLSESNDNNDANESSCSIDCYTIFDYKVQNNLFEDIEKIQKIFEELSYNILRYNIQQSKEENTIDDSLYSYLLYIFRYINFRLQNNTLEFLIEFSKNLLELCENLSQQLIPSIQIYENLSLKSIPVKLFFQLQMFFLVFAFKFAKSYFRENDIPRFHDMCRIITDTSQRLVKHLLQFGFDSLNSGLRKQNSSKYSSMGINNNDYFIEVWIVTIHIMDFSNNLFGEFVPNFWTLLNSELKIINSSEIYEFLDHEKCWYSIINLTVLYQFNISGVSGVPNGLANWIMIEKILSNFFENTEIYKKELGNSQNMYIRTLFGRCHYLISTWKWSNAKSIVIFLYTFFCKRQLRNLINENTPGYPSFIQNLKDPPSTSIETSDTCFHIFLKVIILVLDQLKIQLNSSFIPSKDLKILISRITPLHNRKYSNSQELSIQDFISLENHHSLLLILFRIVPNQYRPPIAMIQDLVQLENAHCKAKLVNLKAWLYLTRFLLFNSNNDDFQAICNWYDLVLDTTREEYLSIYRTYKRQFESDILKYYSNDKLLKYNLKQLEDVMISCLRCKKEIINTVENNVNKGKILQLFCKASSTNLFNSSSVIPSSVIIEALNLTSSFIRQLCKKGSYEKHNESYMEDSQDYGDISVFYDLIDNNDPGNNIEHNFSMIINETLSGEIFQMLSNYLGSDVEISYELLDAVIECWVLTADLLVRNGIKEWSNYLDYGQESWIRFGNNSKINKAGVVFMSKVIQECPNAYFSYRITFISYWFRVIVENKLYNQHTLTSLILNIDFSNKLWKNVPFSKKSGLFEIKLHEIKYYQFSLISNTLANMGEIYTHLESENIMQNTKSEFLTYLSNLFHSMKDTYQKLVQENDSDIKKYIDLCQKLIGCVLQYCGEFVNENSLPILDWFTNSTNFPQPEEDIIYTAKKLKGYEKRNLNNPLIQQELFRFIKAKCEIALFEHKRNRFSTLMRLVMSDTEDNNIAMHIKIQTLNLVCFVIDEVFSAYIAYSRSHITWIYIIPMLEATKELFSGLLQYKYQNFYICSILNIMESFFQVLLSCLKTFFESSTSLAIYGSVKIFEILAVLVELLGSINYTDYYGNKHLYIAENMNIEDLWKYISKFLKLTPIFVSWISWGKENIRWPDLYIVELQKKYLETIQRQIYREWTLKKSQKNYTWLHNFRNQEISLISDFNQEEEIKQLLLKSIFDFIACLFSCGGVWELLIKELIPSIIFKGLSVDHNVIIKFMSNIGELNEYDYIWKNICSIPNNMQIIYTECLSNLFI
ncbi:hypothetical protein T552_03501 [Pneumocystis carinii B80]|uniref:Uncharacterized protein n=1 Tax=Pneumocystis carinii (strain B80) TaxID=1408658 RepID=A0A0W4ZB59_PNEC8|nr:hypothetical protein T552_03501 [Pneumocystis carinii B80]KTW25641.1 hypothetical protein T552_03501 [Pneumocystis carinii B80]